MHKTSDSSTEPSMTDKEGVLILIDRLGTKDIWKNDPIDVAATWDTLLLVFEEQIYNILDKKIYTVNFRVFSDTICITVFGDTKESSVVNVGKFLIVFMINSLYRGINFRGCISYGRIIQTKNSILGPAIDEAARILQFTTMDWHFSIT
ncbi:MAG: hypothetical protein R1F52_00655 [Candidatus Nitrosoabyssus spongiisocia]|nr:MAG: hypothetical protein R1F52_00655 [Nitrosopumilaceae archaeon AB1(1)]